jgi:hypothetical protein
MFSGKWPIDMLTDSKFSFTMYSHSLDGHRTSFVLAARHPKVMRCGKPDFRDTHLNEIASPP